MQNLVVGANVEGHWMLVHLTYHRYCEKFAQQIVAGTKLKPRDVFCILY